MTRLLGLRLGGSGPKAALWWNGDIFDLTPDLIIDWDDPQAYSTITVYRCPDGNGFVTNTTWQYVVQPADLLAGVIALDLGTWPVANYDVRARVLLADGVTVAADYSDTLNMDFVDVTAPLLSAASATSTGTTTGSGAVTTDEGNGTLYWVLTSSATPPSAAQVEAGQDHTGAAAAKSGSQTVYDPGAHSLSFTGLSNATTYYAYYMHKDQSGNSSAVAAPGSFTTTAPWVSIFTPSAALNSNNTAWSGKSIRVVATVTGGGGQLRLTLTPPSSGNSLVLSHVSVGIWSANEADVAATPVEAKFSGASGVTLTAGGSDVVSDALTLTAVNGDKVVVIMDVTSGDFRVRGGGASNVNSYYKNGTSWTSQTFASPTTLTGWDMAVAKIEAL